MTNPAVAAEPTRVSRTWVRAHAHGLALAAVMLAGVLLRVYQLGAESYWFDEIYTLYDAGSGAGASPLRTGSSVASTAYLLIAAAWMRAFGASEVATRALSALCGSGCIALTYVVGREWLDRRTGLIAAALLALSEFQIHYAQDFRFYAPLLLFSLLSFLFFIRMLRGGGSGSQVLYALFTLLALYTHTHALFSVLAQGLYLLVRRRDMGDPAWKRSALTAGVVVLATLPMLASAARTALEAGEAGALGWIEQPTVSLLGRTLYWYVLPLRHERTWSAMALTAAAAGGVLIIGLAIHVLRMGARRWLRSLAAVRDLPAALVARRTELSLLLLWALCPIVAPFVLSRVVGPMYVERYTIAASPAWYLLIALALGAIRRVVPIGLALAALAVLVVPGLAHYYAVDVKEQWREVADYIAAEGKPGDVIVLAPADHGWEDRALSWYYEGALPRCAVDADLDASEIAGAFRACAAGFERSWLVMRGPAPLLHRFEAALLEGEQSGMSLTPQRDFVRIDLFLAEAPAP